jgi:glycosyltransferase involved in cell wall biosynthesis
VKLIIDCTHLRLYPGWAKGDFHGGTEGMAMVLAAGLAEKGHTVHLVAPGLDAEEQRADTLWYWPEHNKPTRADFVVMVSSLAGCGHYEADGLIYATNGTELPAPLSPDVAGIVSAYPVFSQTHARLLCRMNPGIPPERCVVTGLGVDLGEYDAFEYLQEDAVNIVRTKVDYPYKVPGRIWVGNDPARGLLHTLDVFDLVKKEMPEAELRVTYDFDRQFGAQKWRQNAMGEMFWEMKRRLEGTPGVVKLGSVDRDRVVREQLEAQVHLWPSDPPNVGSQIHGLAQLEAAAAGCALVLSDVEAFPELFAGVADLLPVPGTYIADPEGDGYRVDAQDWAGVVLDLMNDPDALAKASQASERLAEQHSWSAVVDRWDQMIGMLAGSGETVEAL